MAHVSGGATVRRSLGTVRTTRLRIRLRDVAPTVVRIIDVPASTTLAELHALLQAALGWTDSHLHQFVAGGVAYGVPDEDDWEEERDETGVRLGDLPDRFVYLYDFGDGWEHDVDVLGAGGDQPGCRYGEGSCPPEDCGGPQGYADLLAVLADPSHEDHAHMREWAGTLKDFDEAGTDLLVRQTVGAVPASVRMVFGLVEGGVKLTPGGRLPRVLVRQVQDQRPLWDPLNRPATIEEHLLPLAVLRDLLRHVGLLRLSKGILRPTRAAGDDAEVVSRLRSWFDSDRFTSILADLTVAALATSGPARLDDLAGTVYGLLGHGWARGGQPLTQDDVRTSISHLGPVMRGLDLLEIAWPLWRAGPSARSLLPGATALAHHWSTPTAGTTDASGRRA